MDDPILIGQSILWFFEGAFKAAVPLGLLLVAWEIQRRS